MSNNEEKTAEPKEGDMLLLDCPFCGDEVDWCECGECHRIRCKTCDAMFDFADEYNPDTMEEMKAYCAKGWNSRAEANS